MSAGVSGFCQSWVRHSSNVGSSTNNQPHSVPALVKRCDLTCAATRRPELCRNNTGTSRRISAGLDSRNARPGFSPSTELIGSSKSIAWPSIGCSCQPASVRARRLAQMSRNCSSTLTTASRVSCPNATNGSTSTVPPATARLHSAATRVSAIIVVQTRCRACAIIRSVSLGAG